jgi:hypothetical protein
MRCFSKVRTVRLCGSRLRSQSITAPEMRCWQNVSNLALCFGVVRLDGLDQAVKGGATDFVVGDLGGQAAGEACGVAVHEVGIVYHECVAVLDLAYA